MNDLALIAQSVAKALGLSSHDNNEPYPFDSPRYYYAQSSASVWLLEDGSNLFDPHWQARCRDWLLERGYITQGKHGVSIYFDDDTHESPNGLSFQCPAAEFCARAIHELMKGKE